MPLLTESNVTIFNRVHLLKLKLEQGRRYFKGRFSQLKFNLFEVDQSDSLRVKLCKKTVTVLCDGADLVVNLSKLPAALTVKVYHAVIDTPAPSDPLGSLERHSLLQRLTDLGFYSVALPFNILKKMFSRIAGAPKNLDYFVRKSIDQLFQSALHYCHYDGCDGETAVRTPHDPIQEMAGPEAEAGETAARTPHYLIQGIAGPEAEATELSLSPNSDDRVMPRRLSGGWNNGEFYSPD